MLWFSHLENLKEHFCGFICVIIFHGAQFTKNGFELFPRKEKSTGFEIRIRSFWLQIGHHFFRDKNQATKIFEIFSHKALIFN